MKSLTLLSFVFQFNLKKNNQNLSDLIELSSNGNNQRICNLTCLLLPLAYFSTTNKMAKYVQADMSALTSPTSPGKQ